jgi:hypothetical protein
MPRFARGSGTAACSLTGAGLKVALSDLLTPPTTSMREAVTAALPEARIAEEELESTSSKPGIWMPPLPEMVSSPPALVLSRKMERATLAFKMAGADEAPAVSSTVNVIV